NMRSHEQIIDKLIRIISLRKFRFIYRRRCAVGLTLIRQNTIYYTVGRTTLHWSTLHYTRVRHIPLGYATLHQTPTKAPECAGNFKLKIQGASPVTLNKKKQCGPS